MTKRYALLIGNSSFQHTDLARLSAPQNDVRRLAQVLEDQKIGNFDQVKLKLDAGLIDSKSEILWLYENRNIDDVVLLYYSGHGLRDSSGCFYLSMTETNPDNPDPGSIDEFWLRRVMDNCYSKRQITILDCCHSGALFPSENEVKKDSLNEKILSQKTFDPSGHGRYIFAATTAENSAFERDGRSLYTHAIVSGLQDGSAAPEKSLISVFDLQEFLVNRINEKHPNMIRPQLWVDASANPEPLIICANPNPRQSLPNWIIESLWSDEFKEISLAVYELREIAQTDNSHLSNDAITALENRLKDPDTISLSVGVRIQSALNNLKSRKNTIDTSTNIDSVDDIPDISDLPGKLQNIDYIQPQTVKPDVVEFDSINSQLAISSEVDSLLGEVYDVLYICSQLKYSQNNLFDNLDCTKSMIDKILRFKSQLMEIERSEKYIDHMVIVISAICDYSLSRSKSHPKSIFSLLFPHRIDHTNILRDVEGMCNSPSRFFIALKLHSYIMSLGFLEVYGFDEFCEDFRDLHRRVVAACRTQDVSQSFELSPNWRGEHVPVEPAPRSVNFFIPVAACLFVLILIYCTFYYDLKNETNLIISVLAKTHPITEVYLSHPEAYTAPPPPPPPPLPVD